jgi:outer membrane protein OmpA-like peptidoglycan-associated protein
MTEATRRAAVSACLALGICDLVAMNVVLLPDLGRRPVRVVAAPVAARRASAPLRLDVEMAPPEIMRPAVEQAERPAPAEQPARAEQPAGAVLVFFATNVYHLDSHARAILDHVAPRLAEGGQTIMVDGYADGRGRELDSRRLSRRRALVVARRLQEGGVPRSGLVVRAFGSSRAAAGTRVGAPRHNRRVEIALLPEGL